MAHHTAISHEEIFFMFHYVIWHEEVIRKMTAKLISGTSDSSDLASAIRFLKRDHQVMRDLLKEHGITL